MVREATIESYLVRRTKAHGGEVRKVKWTGRRNAPDRLVLAPGVVVLVELKKPGLKAGFPAGAHERAQHREHERLRRFGMRVEVVDSYVGVDALFAK